MPPSRSRVAFRHHAAEMRVLRTSYASLTAREREMALVVLGLLNKQVAGDLRSEITAKALEAKSCAS